VGKTVIGISQEFRPCFRKADVADTVFYIQQGKIKLTVMSEQGKEAVVAILEPGQFFWRRLHEWSFDPHRDDNGDGELRHHRNCETAMINRPP